MADNTIKLRTISQLPAYSSTEALTSTTLSNNLFETSVYDSGIYTSRHITYSNLSTILNKNIDDAMASAYGMKLNGDNIKLTDLSSEIDTIKTGNLSIDGVKTFTGTLKAKPYHTGLPTSPSPVATAADVDKLLSQAPVYIANNSHYSAVRTLTTNNVIKEDNNSSLYEFKLTNIQNDYKSSQSDVVSIRNTGFLSLYGWLAADTNIVPQEAWVALEGKINGNWVILQVQPFILGSNNQIIQYLSFNLPVAMGLNLRISTGFKLSISPTYIQTGKTLVYNALANGQNMVNTFYGTVFS